MSAAKRRRSPTESEDDATNARVAKTSHACHNAAAEKSPAQQLSDEVQVTVEIDSEYGERKFERIVGFADAGQSRVAECSAMLLRREWLRRAFWVDMEELCEETSSLAFDLFDRYGRLDREYCEHKIRKGSGVWGKELDHGDILLFQSINVEPLRRRQGLGTKLVNAILDKAGHESESLFAFASPTRLTLELDYNDVPEQSEIFRHFFRSMGFRRVGTSGWLAFTDNDSHPSRQLDKAQDWDDPESSKEEQPTPELIDTILGSLCDPSTTGMEYVFQMEKAFAVEENAPLWMYTHEEGDTILHAAAICRKADLISYIMSKNPHLAGKRNDDGYTPLEALRSNMELQRTRRCIGRVTDVISDSFEGFCQSDIACLAALTGTEIFDLTKLSDQDTWAVSSATDGMASRVREVNPIRNTLRLKYGCTCGQCIGGFLSPRMRFALLFQAETKHDMLREFPEIDCGSDWVELNDDLLCFFSPEVRQNLETNKSMREGFVNMCDHIASCLRQKRLPNTATVLDFYRDEVSEWPPVTRNYLQRGGTVAAVAMMLFDRAMDADEWAGDGTLMEVYEEDIEAPIHQFPACRNDHEFGFVSRMCGYEGIM